MSRSATPSARVRAQFRHALYAYHHHRNVHDGTHGGGNAWEGDISRQIAGHSPEKIGRVIKEERNVRAMHGLDTCLWGELTVYSCSPDTFVHAADGTAVRRANYWCSTCACLPARTIVARIGQLHRHPAPNGYLWYLCCPDEETQDVVLTCRTCRCLGDPPQPGFHPLLVATWRFMLL